MFVSRSVWFVDCWKSRQNEWTKRKKTERERRCINNDGKRHCISRGLVRVHDSYRQTMFYSPVAFSQRTGEYQDRPSLVNNQIRSVRKSLSCSRKRHRWRGQARGQGAAERTEEGYQRSSLGTIAVPRCSIRTFTRRCSSDMLAPISKSEKEFKFKLHIVNLKRVGFMLHSLFCNFFTRTWCATSIFIEYNPIHKIISVLALIS